MPDHIPHHTDFFITYTEKTSKLITSIDPKETIIFPQVLELLERIVDAKIASYDTDAEKIREKFTSLVAGQRLYLMKNLHDWRKLWRQIRENEDLADLVLSTYVELRTRLTPTTLPLWTISQILADAYGSLTDNETISGMEPDPVIDKDTREHLPERADISWMFDVEPWMSVIYLYQILLHQRIYDNITPRRR